MARIGVFGGTFDPIHNGHLKAAQEAALKLGLVRVLFVPTADSWQKQSVTAAHHRVAMLKLALQSHPLFELDLTDVNRGGATYTVDTLRELKAKYSNDELFFILGADSYATIGTWKDSEALPALAKFAVVTRPGFDLPAQGSDQIEIVSIEALNLSATEVREACESGFDISHLVPAEVANYIEINNLYEVKA